MATGQDVALVSLSLIFEQERQDRRREAKLGTIRNAGAAAVPNRLLGRCRLKRHSDFSSSILNAFVKNKPLKLKPSKREHPEASQLMDQELLPPS